MKPFRFLQFNMQFGQVWDAADPDNAPIDLEVAIAEMKRHDADIITLQEVERAQPGGAQIDPPPNLARIRAALPDYDCFFSYPRQDERELPFGIGLAILSRTPLTETERHEIPSPPVEFEFMGETKTPTDRLLIGARTQIGGREVTILNTHLLAFFMLRSSSGTHGSQRQQIQDLLARAQGPTLLAGDFNVSAHAELVAQYGKVGFRTVQQTEVTWLRRPYVLDHIFYNEGLHCVGHQVVPSTASDHLPVVADLSFVE
ncbi:endonuclease/exonuclease/phosphatase family protein [Synoicihabitans lomoniglobus]|uniref:Endonuclease/exonuclease/phosphatase family protein n=1 Tax=Synoicihabitans lomoniglobus TaxID=2909285 RepID=A0AAF0CNS5_9BACT|nr:endonuclease/exonuclease/phosphatase family protein [Opitutaceae bacterium LMO-M01]WED64956.1 endonuclease/exonuclease/phosphatase family protein [Opitutaceae bacterium LMO-M01]